MINWLVSSLVKQRKVGSSSARRCKPIAQLFPVRLGLRLDRHADDRLGEGRRKEGHVKILVAQGVAGDDVAQADQGGDVARINRVHVLALAALDDHEAADAVAFAGAGVVNGVAFSQLAGINAEKDQLAGVDIRPQFKGQGTEFAVVVGFDLDHVVGARLGAFGRAECPAGWADNPPPRPPAPGRPFS